MFFYFTQNQADAQYITGPVASGAGFAGRGAADSAEIIFLNPAVLAHAPEFAVGLFMGEVLLPDKNTDTFSGFSFTDNSPDNLVPGGLAYFQRERTFTGLPRVKEDYFHISTGGFAWQYWAFGMSLVRVDDRLSSGLNYTQWNGVLGVHYNPDPDWGFGLVLYHFAIPSDQVPTHLRLVPKGAFGINYLFQNFVRIRFDISKVIRDNAEGILNEELGFETKLGTFFMLRLGHQWQNWEHQNFLTIGLSFLGPQFKIDYAYVRDREDGSHSTQSVDLRFPF